MKLKPNIGAPGRWVRGIAGMFALFGAWTLSDTSLWLALGLGGLALFLFFEAVRGWCGARACGMKTPF